MKSGENAVIVIHCGGGGGGGGGYSTIAYGTFAFKKIVRLIYMVARTM